MSEPTVTRAPRSADEDISLRCSFTATGARGGADLARALRQALGDETIIAISSSRLAGRGEATVTLTTTPVPFTLDALQAWEREMLHMERLLPGCRFIGWRTSRTPATSIGPKDRPTEDGADARWRRSQRELVIASLLRRPPGERRGVVHGRRMPR